MGNHLAYVHTASPYQFQCCCIVRWATGVGGSERYIVTPEKVIYRDWNGNAKLCWGEEENSASTLH
ncbi:unnamed protein product [marine sediment metagenome]|uniref:Uncharacterized protein n=1 Tax=marine sediment metagenome TaxID=412755 RepID=X1LUR3_9ZZZZ